MEERVPYQTTRAGYDWYEAWLQLSRQNSRLTTQLVRVTRERNELLRERDAMLIAQHEPLMKGGL